MINEIKEIIKHSSVFGIANILRKGIGFFMIPVYTHFLTTADYGTMEILDLVNMVIIHLVGLRIGAGVIRFYVMYDEKHDKQEVFTTALLFAAVMSLMVLLIFQSFSSSIGNVFIGGQNATKFIRIMTIVISLRIVATIPENYLLALKKSILLSSISTCTLIISLSLNIFFLVVLKMGVLGLLYAMLIAKIIDTTVLLLFSVRGIHLAFSIKKLKEMMVYCLPLVPASFAMFSLHFVDRFFIKAYCNLDDVGVYSLGYKFGMMLSLLLSSPFFKIWNTKRFEIAKEPDANKIFDRMFTYYTFVVTSVALCISIFAFEVVHIMAPDTYSNAALVIPLIVLSYVFMGMSNFSNLGMMLTQKTKHIMYIQITTAVINLMLNYLLVPLYGIIGAALATVLSFAILLGLTLTGSQKAYKIDFEYTRITGIVLIASIIFLASKLISAPLYASIIMKIVLLLLFPCFLWIFKLLHRDEIQGLQYFFKLIFGKIRKPASEGPVR